MWPGSRRAGRKLRRKKRHAPVHFTHREATLRISNKHSTDIRVTRRTPPRSRQQRSPNGLLPETPGAVRVLNQRERRPLPLNVNPANHANQVARRVKNPGDSATPCVSLFLKCNSPWRGRYHARYMYANSSNCSASALTETHCRPPRRPQLEKRGRCVPSAPRRRRFNPHGRPPPTGQFRIGTSKGPPSPVEGVTRARNAR